MEKIVSWRMVNGKINKKGSTILDELVPTISESLSATNKQKQISLG